MSAAAASRPRRALLAVMPWASPVMPSLAASLLKASLVRAEIPCDIRYFSLDWDRRVLDAWGEGPGGTRPHLDPRLHTLFRISQGALGEWIFARARFGVRPAADRVFRERLLAQCPPLRADPELARFYFGLPRRVPGFIRACAAALDWTRYGWVGFTVNGQQTLAAALLAREIKRRRPDLPVILGGANAEGEPGAERLARFPEFDGVFSGEADGVLPQLVAAALERRPMRGLPGLRMRGARPARAAPPPKMESLDTLPLPDFGDYFRDFRRAGLPRRMTRFLPLELSRGCWWRDRAPCVFCGVNGARAEYRAKRPARALGEIRALVRRWGIRRLFLVDTVYHPRRFRPLMDALARGPDRIEFFTPIRPDLPAEDYGRLARAGCSHVLPGIESLSTVALRRMNKGSTALANALCLRRCREAGLRAAWNLLYGWPGEDPSEYRDQFEILRRITHLDPPGSVRRVILARHSTAWESAARLGYRRPRPDPAWALIYPFPARALQRLCWFREFDYAGGYDPEPEARPIRELIRRWKTDGADGTLEFRRSRDGGGRILDRRFNRADAGMRLDPPSAGLYAYCRAPRSWTGIRRFLAGPSGGGLSPRGAAVLLDRFVARLYMARDGDRWLSVAVRGKASPRPAGRAGHDAPAISTAS